MGVADIDFDEGMLVPISVETLRASNVLPFDLYVPSERRRRRLVLYRQRKHPIAESDLQRLKQRGVGTLYIAQGDSATYREYFREFILKNQDIPAVQRYQVLREATRTVLADTFTGADLEPVVETTRELSEGMVHTVCDSQIVLNDLLRVMPHDGSVCSHAINVATYSLLLAKRLGIHRSEELLQIGQGALLHDIGLRRMPQRIVEKSETAIDTDRRSVQEHPIQGLKELCRREDLTWGQLMMVYSHHERCDGRGYPVGLVQSEIHEYARLCSIADVYDALSRHRPCRRVSRRRDALEYLDRQAGRAFDKEMMRCWISVIDTAT